SVLGLTWGFWGSIAHGAIFGRMQVVPRRRAAGAAERSRKLMKRASSQITEAEALVGTVVDMYQRRLDRDWTTARALLAELSKPAPSPVFVVTTSMLSAYRLLSIVAPPVRRVGRRSLPRSGLVV